MLLTIAPRLHAQNLNEMVRILADSLKREEVKGAQAEHLIGHVHFNQGPIWGSSDEAYRFTEQNRVELVGNVVIHHDTLKLEAPHVTYDGNTHLAHADSNIRILDRDVVLTAESVDYNAIFQLAQAHKHVVITQFRSVGRCDELTYYRATETSLMRGRVVILSDSGSLRADEVDYVKALEHTTARGKVDLVSDSLKLNSDWFFDSKKEGESFARGNVIVRDLRGQTTIFGDTMARFAKQHYSIFPRKPLLVLVDSSLVKDSTTGAMVMSYDTTFFRSKVMETYQSDTSRFIATDSVRMLRKNFAATGGYLNYNRTTGVMTLSRQGRVHTWFDSTEVVSDSLALLFVNNHISRVYAVGHAFATSVLDGWPGAGRMNQLQGERMHLRIERDTVRDLLDINSAISIFFHVSNGVPSGVNRASGDTIRIDFHDKAVQRVTVISGTEGQYFPERFVKGRPEAFHLTGYERHDKLRPIRDEYVIPGAETDPVTKKAEQKKAEPKKEEPKKQQGPEPRRPAKKMKTP